MVLENEEDACKFINYAQDLLYLLEYDDDGQIYEGIVKHYSEIFDYNSFTKFFKNFLNDCPNKAVIINKTDDENAKKVWDSIDFPYKNERLGKKESKFFITKIMEHQILLIKEYFELKDEKVE